MAAKDKNHPDFQARPKNTQKGVLHPRNRHQGRYDFKKLQETSPELKAFVAINHYGDESIDFAHPEAVKALNRALLKEFYGISQWDIPEQYLCPPIPGRADYIHHIADLLAEKNQQIIPRGPSVIGLDIGVGANCIYPIIGHQEYDWRFVGADLDPEALTSAQKIVDSNPSLNSSIELRLQKSPPHIFEHMIQPTDRFDFTMCNPPFHSSEAESQSIQQKKWRNLGKAAVANFGGKSNELWCEGGEGAFIKRMIQESTDFKIQCGWFTSFVSKEESLPEIYAEIKKINAKTVKTIEMAQGQKKSRFVAWTFGS